MEKIFDAERFRVFAERNFGLDYLNKLSEITKKNHKTVYKWCSPNFAPKKLDTHSENEISKVLLKQGVSINWSEFYKSIDGDLPSTPEKVEAITDSFDPYDALIQAKRDVNTLQNRINDLNNELLVKEEENIRLRQKIAQMSNL